MESLCIEIHAAGCDDEQHQQQHRGEKTTEHSHSHRAAVSTVPPHTAAFISASVAGCPPHVVIVSTADTTASERTACECESECHLSSLSSAESSEEDRDAEAPCSSPDTDSTPIDEEKQPHADHSPECDDTSVLGLTPEIVLATVVATANTHHQPDVDDDLSIMHSVCLDIAEQLEVDFAYHEIADLVRDQPASISPTSESWLSNLSEDEQKSAANERTQPHNLALAQLLDKAAADRLIARGKAQQALTNAAAAREAVRRQSREAVRRQSLTRSDPAGSVESVEPVPPPPPPPVFVHCGICQEEVERSKAVLFSHGVHDGPYPPNLGRVSSVPQCMHRFCRECISSYLAHEITDGKVMRIRCPGREEDGGKQCTCTAPKQFIKKYTEQELFDKYERFLKLKTDDSYRSCPNRECLHVQQKKSGASDSMQCDQCQQLYCFRHDLAHPPGTACSTYEKQLKQEAKQSIEHINENTVRCPWPLCRVKTIKASGCNHMTCTECRTEYCYLCGGAYLGGLHFAPLNLIGCPGMKGDELPAGSRSGVVRFLFRWIICFPIMLALIGVALAIVLAVLGVWLPTFIAFAPFYCIAYICVRHCCITPSPPYNYAYAYGYQSQSERRKENLKKVVFWGPFMLAKITDWMC